MICLIADAVLSLTSPDVEVWLTIVNNVKQGEGPPYDFESVERLRVVDMAEKSLGMGVTWTDHYLPAALGVIGMPTKYVTYRYFSHFRGVGFDRYLSVVHDRACVSEQSRVSSGCYLGPGVVIAPYVEVGNLVSMNRGALVGHHTRIGAFSTLNPGCSIAGGCEIGEYVTVGMGANVFDGVKVGRESIIGAGALVTKDVPENSVAYGVPAKVVRRFSLEEKGLQLCSELELDPAFLTGDDE